MNVKFLRALERKLGSYIKQGNGEYAFCCPKCGDEKHHMGVNVNKGVYNCFRCKYGGSITKLLRDLILEVEVPETDNHPAKPFRLQNPIEGSLSIDFISNTGSHTRKLIRKEAKRRGTKISVLDGIGCGVSPEYPLRLIFPIWNDKKFVYFVARSLDSKSKLKEVGPSRQSTGWRSRTEVLFLFDEVEKYPTTLVVNEGVWDALAVQKAGYDAVASLGCGLSGYQIGMLISKKPQRILIGYDNDDAGIMGAKNAIRAIRKRFRGEVAAVQFKKDPDELSINEIQKSIKEAVR